MTDGCIDLLIHYSVQLLTYTALLLLLMQLFIELVTSFTLFNLVSLLFLFYHNFFYYYIYRSDSSVVMHC